MNRALRIALRGALGLGAVAAGVAIFAGLVASKPTPEQRAPQDRGLLVKVAAVQAADREISIEVQGLVIAAEQVQVQSEVQGRVRWVNPALVAGGLIKKGQVLVRIDARDYQLQVSQRAAEIERARVELELERGRKLVAEREWKILGAKGGRDLEGGASMSRDASVSARARVLREPQIRAAKNAVAAAKSGHRRAALLVEKAVLRAPFNAVVISENVALGQLVGPQSPIATLVASDVFYVRASVPTAELPAVRVPGVDTETGEGARATVRHETGNGQITASGRVLRVLPDLDPAGQMARVIIRIEDPLALAAGADHQALLLSSHVMAKIDAGTLSGVVQLPREALHDGREVFVMKAGVLELRHVSIVWRTDREVFVRGGLEDGDLVVTSRLTAPMPGMKLRAQGESGDELATR